MAENDKPNIDPDDLKTIKKLMEDITKEQDKQSKLAEKAKKDLQDQIKAQKESLADARKAYELSLEAQSEEAKRAKQDLEDAREILEIAKREVNDLGPERLKIAKELVEFAEENYAHEARKTDLLKEQVEEQEKNLKALERKLKFQESTVLGAKALNKIGSEAPSLIKNLFSGDPRGLTSAIGSINSSLQGLLSKTITKGFKDAGTSLIEMGKAGVTMKDGIGGMLKGLSGAAVAAAALGLSAMATTVVSLAIKLGDLEAAFMKTTGATKEFARNMSEAAISARENFGLSMDNFFKASTALRQSYTDFTMINSSMASDIATTVGVLEGLGVSANDAANAIQVLTKVTGVSGQVAAQQILDLEKFAEQLGVAPAQITQDLAAMKGSLAKFGDDYIRTFKRVEIASKNTGLAVERILSLTEKFDTFEGAATQAGKLNAALGGNFVNAMDLMMQTDPVGRLEQIRDAILDTGLSFDEMSYYQRNMYKDMLGLSDVNELALLLSGRTDLMSQSFGKTSQSIEEAAERMKEMASFQEKLEIAFAKMIPIMMPLVDGLIDIAENLEPFAPLLEGAAYFASGLVGALASLLGLFDDSANEFSVFNGVLMALSFSLTAVALAFAAVSLGLSPLIAGILAAIAAISALGYLLFHKRNSPTFFEGISLLGEEKFPQMARSISVTADEMENQNRQVERSRMNTATTYATMNNMPAYSSAGTPSQTIEKPVSITLDGGKVSDFIVKVVGEKIKDISIIS